MFFLSKKSKSAKAAARKKSQKWRSPQRPLGVESLEDRKLMAFIGQIELPQVRATFDLADHVLRITGTNGADNIAIQQVAGNIVVPGAEIKALDHGMPWFNSDSVLPAALGIARIEVNAYGGADTVSMSKIRTGLPQLDMFLQDLPMTVFGGEGDDTIHGGEAADLLYGQGGKDKIYGNGGVDKIYGGGENDWLYGGWGNDWLYGQTGNDSLYGGADADQLYGGTESDTLHGEGGADTLRGEAGNDLLYGGADADQVLGGADNDIMYGDGGADILRGEAGRDWLDGGEDSDKLFGGTENDTLYGGGGADTLRGEAGNDWLHGGADADQLYGGTESDYLYGDGGWDTLRGEGGNDWLYGGADSDQLYGGADNDNLYGEGGSDTLRGEAGNDGLFGGMGTDNLWGGATYLAAGTKGNDRYLVVVDEPNSVGPDRLLDFDAANDARIKFANSPAVVNAKMGGQTGLYSFAAGNWTDADIQRIDVALGNLHQTTGNTRLLKTAAKGELGGFLAIGAQTDTNTFRVGAWNGGGTIGIINPAMKSDASLRLAVYHEIGHNWDTVEENKYVTNFRGASGWQQFAVAPANGYTASLGVNGDGTDDNWYYLTALSGGFAYDYGKTNPLEDMATTWETYFINRYHGGATQVTASGMVANQSKWSTLDSLFSDLRLS